MVDIFEKPHEYGIRQEQGFFYKKFILPFELSKKDMDDVTKIMGQSFEEIYVDAGKKSRDIYVTDSKFSEKGKPVHFGNRNGFGEIMVTGRIRKPISEENKQLLRTIFSYAPISEKLKEHAKVSEQIAF